MARQFHRREFLFAAGLTAAMFPLANLLGGCGGGGGNGKGGGGGNPDVGAFTVTPDRAAPGTMITLTGAMLTADQAVTVKFGDTLTRVVGYVRDGATDGVRVIVPPFLDASGNAVPPAAPMSVTLQVEGHAMKASTNQFTVLDLPPAPGASAAIAAETAAFSSFLGDFTENIVRITSSTYGDLPAYPNPNEFEGTVAAIQYARTFQYMIDGAGEDNPYSISAIMTKKSPLTADLAVSQDVLDALIAQGPVAATFQALAQNFLGGLNQLVPGSVTPRADRHVALPTVHGGRAESGAPSSFSNFQVDWDKITQLGAASSIIATIQFAHLLTNVGTATSPFETIAASMMPAIQAAALALGPAAIPVEAVLTAIDGILFVEGVTTKLIGVLANLLPSQITDFYVIVDGENRRTGDPPTDITVQVPTVLTMELIPGANGGPTFSIYGFTGLIVDVATRAFPSLKNFFDSNATAGLAKSLAQGILGFMDGIWAKVQGSAPPEAWSQYKAAANNQTAVEIKPFKFPGVDINTERLVTVQSFSPNLLDVTTENGAFEFVGKSPGDNAGYKTYIKHEALLPGLPTLADVAQEKWFVVGTVNVTAGTVHGTVS